MPTRLRSLLPCAHHTLVMLAVLALGLLALTSANAAPQATDADETERLMAFFERAHEEDLARSPMRQSMLGIKTDYDRWDDLSDSAIAEAHAVDIARLEELRDFDFDSLSPQAQLSYRLFEAITERSIEGYRWRLHSYPVNQMSGWEQRIPSFLINIHRVDDVSDAEAYIARIEATSELVDEVIRHMRVREAAGILPPRFVFPRVIESARNVVTGAPFDDGDPSALLTDIGGKIDALDVDTAHAEQLVDRSRTALLEHLGPAYRKLIEEMQRQHRLADDHDGAWKLPEGEAFYAFQLRQYTTTTLGPAEIHRMGVEHTARIHDEMRGIMAQIGFDGDLQEFFAFMREDDRFYLPDTEEGRARYLDEARDVIDTITRRLPEVFSVLPEAELEVRRVEPFREQAAGKAFYQQPALDGSRPGVYYANLRDMRDMPTYQLEALAYHEGNPGHHMQIAIAQELDGVPTFQRLARFTAYTEGWGLYSEYFPKEMGFYEDPYSDFGRLAMELWRAGRLVVDTGIHAKRWTREEAIDWLAGNTPNPQGDIVNAIERYIVMPGQATAYMIGMQRILELREGARAELGDAFDIRGFHDEVLSDGPVPLDILEEKIDAWIARTRG